jgi:hypothetical protein
MYRVVRVLDMDVIRHVEGASPSLIRQSKSERRSLRLATVSRPVHSAGYGPIPG